MQEAVLLVHGGAGKASSYPHKAREGECKEALKLALQTGYNILRNGGTSLDAVEAAIKTMEDLPLFNAGKGAVLANSGICELDASIMDGKNKRAGAVAGITIAKNPIMVARAVMEKSDCVLMASHGADVFAQEQKLEIVTPSYFHTKENLEKLKQVQAVDENIEPSKSGTVGAVALDQEGNLAAGTSTGGRVANKYSGRIGDSAIIGAGTFADNKTCAVSTTGYGEIFIRNVAAYDIAALIEYKGLSVQKAADIVIKSKIPLLGGYGGVIIIDRHGHYAMSFNTETMLRGYITADGVSKIDIHQ